MLTGGCNSVNNVNSGGGEETHLTAAVAYEFPAYPLRSGRAIRGYSTEQHFRTSQSDTKLMGLLHRDSG